LPRVLGNRVNLLSLILSGYIKKSLFLLIFLVLNSVINGQISNSCKISLDKKLPKNDIVVSGNKIVIDYSVPEINLEGFNNQYGSFYRITVPGHNQTMVPGKPELPVISRLIALPEDGKYKVRITEVRSEAIKPARKKIKGILFPAQDSETKSLRDGKRVFAIDKSAYASRDLLKSDTVTIEMVGTVRGTRIGNLIITPARYDPHSNILEVITSMKIEILFTGSEKSVRSSGESAVFHKTLSKSVLNYNEYGDIPTFSDRPLRMVILTDTTFRTYLEPFIRWKTIKGIKVDLLFRGSDYAGETFSEIKETLTDLYNSSSKDNPPPDYLLIVGNTIKIPYYGTGNVTGNVTDMYYGEFDGEGDYIPDLFIGRLPVADTNELRNVIDKLIQYEKFEYADTNRFHSNAMITSGYDASYANYMNGQIKYAITNYLTPENRIRESHFYYPQTQAAHKDSVIKLINRGTSFVNYTGHGSATAWLHINIDTSDVSKLENTDMYPFIISNACQTSKFDIRSLGNKMVVSKEKGAIGFIGCSNDSFWNEDFYWAVGLGIPSDNPTYQTTGPGALDRLFHTHGEPQQEWYTTMGQIVYAGNLSVSSSTSSRKKYYWETYNLVGDPSMIPFIGTPDSFRIELPDTLPNGIKSWTFIADPGSYIAVSHSGELWDASHASASGSVTLNFPDLAQDSCFIVITGQNKVPLMKTIYFSQINKEYLNLTSSKISDASGNNNGQADFGEILYLNFTIENLGLTDIKDLSAKITSASEYITILNDSVMIGTLPANSEKTVNNQLSLKVSDNITDNTLVTVDLILRDKTGVKSYSVDFYIHAPELDILSYRIDDSDTGNGDQVAGPGETFHLIFFIKNDGSSSISGKFSISSLSEEITILEPTKNSGILQDGVLTEIPILVKLDQSVKTGTSISVNTLLDCGPYNVEKTFTFRVGRIRESFESSSFRVFPWINVSKRPWIITDAGARDGNLSARSGTITHNEASSLIIKTFYESDDSLKFYYQVSSEANYDYLAFYLNDFELFRKSGETLWEKKVIPVTAGFNKMEWRYKKDPSVSQGKDCAMIDLIDFAGPGAVTYIHRDMVTGRIINPVQKEKLGREAVAVKVLNTGYDTINGFNLAYSLNERYPVKQYFDNKLIPYGDSTLVTFDVYADLSRYGIYSLTIYSFNNGDECLLNDTLRIDIENTRIDEPLSVFPNPFRDKMTIVINSEIDETARIALINSQGKILIDFEQVIHPGMNEFVIEKPDLPPAVYYLRVEYTGWRRIIPVVKFKSGP